MTTKTDVTGNVVGEVNRFRDFLSLVLSVIEPSEDVSREGK